MVHGPFLVHGPVFRLSVHRFSDNRGPRAKDGPERRTTNQGPATTDTKPALAICLNKQNAVSRATQGVCQPLFTGPPPSSGPAAQKNHGVLRNERRQGRVLGPAQTDVNADLEAELACERAEAIGDEIRRDHRMLDRARIRHDVRYQHDYACIEIAGMRAGRRQRGALPSDDVAKT